MSEYGIEILAGVLVAAFFAFLIMRVRQSRNNNKTGPGPDRRPREEPPDDIGPRHRP